MGGGGFKRAEIMSKSNNKERLSEDELMEIKSRLTK